MMDPIAATNSTFIFMAGLAIGAAIMWLGIASGLLDHATVRRETRTEVTNESTFTYTADEPGAWCPECGEALKPHVPHTHRRVDHV